MSALEKDENQVYEKCDQENVDGVADEKNFRKDHKMGITVYGEENKFQRFSGK